MTLKPCPFCGGISFLDNYDYEELGKTYYVRCDKCYTESFEYNTEQEAIEAWNRRSSGILRVPSEEEWMERFCTPKQFEGYKKRKEMKNGED